jgi:malonyl-CoA/methylmalonyl-CoA synthetase
VRGRWCGTCSEGGMHTHTYTHMPGLDRRQVRIADESSPDCSAPDRPRGEPGQLLVRGAGVFKGYWRRPDASADSFTPDGWYKTGDLCVVDADGYYHILGRMSADIMKSGGYKVCGGCCMSCAAL